MLEDLKKKNHTKYERNGMLKMLERDANVKAGPEKWQISQDLFDLVITFDNRVYDSVLDSFLCRKRTGGDVSQIVKRVNIVNVETRDNHEEAANGAMAALALVEREWSCFITLFISGATKSRLGK